MPTPHTRVLVLRIDAQAQPIAGRLEDENGTGREFAGWLGLARALEVVLSPAAPDGGDRHPRADEPGDRR